MLGPGSGLVGLSISSSNRFTTVLEMASKGCAIVVEGRTFAELTGFRPLGGQTIDAGVIKRAADAATTSRAKALAACRGSNSADYVALAVFLSVCAANDLALRTERHLARQRGL